MKNTTKHTPGPWMQHPWSWNIICQDLGNGNTGKAVSLAHTVIAGLEEDEAHANATLMTTSPEMLEALEDCVQWITANITVQWRMIDGDTRLAEVWLAENKTLQKANAVIKKAKGE